MDIEYKAVGYEGIKIGDKVVVTGVYQKGQDKDTLRVQEGVTANGQHHSFFTIKRMKGYQLRGKLFDIITIPGLNDPVPVVQVFTRVDDLEALPKTKSPEEKGEEISSLELVFVPQSCIYSEEISK